MGAGWLASATSTPQKAAMITVPPIVKWQAAACFQLRGALKHAQAALGVLKCMPLPLLILTVPGTLP